MPDSCAGLRAGLAVVAVAPGQNQQILRCAPAFVNRKKMGQNSGGFSRSSVSSLLKSERWALLPTEIEGMPLAPAPCKSARSGPPEVSGSAVFACSIELVLCRFNLCREVCVPAWERSPWAAVLHASGAVRFHASAMRPDVVEEERSDVVVAGFRVAQVRLDAVRARVASRGEAEHFPASVRLQHAAYSQDDQFAGRARYLCACSQAAMEFADAMPLLAGSRLRDLLDDLLDERLDGQLDEQPPSCVHSDAPRKAYCAMFPDGCCCRPARVGCDLAAPRVKSLFAKL